MSERLDQMFARPPRLDQTRRVLCFPYAGGTASTLSGLAEVVDADVCAFEPPGRQKRSAEPLARNFDELLDPLVEHGGRLFAVPYVLFGHSLGCWMAFELAHKLRRAGLPAPCALVLASARPPQLPRRSDMSTLPDDRFIAELAAMNGTPSEVLADPEMVAHVLPRLRADFALVEGYELGIKPKLDLPFTALGGVADPSVRPAHLQAWSAHCADRFALKLFAGDHFFVHQQQAAVGRVLMSALEQGRSPRMSQPAHPARA